MKISKQIQERPVADIRIKGRSSGEYGEAGGCYGRRATVCLADVIGNVVVSIKDIPGLGTEYGCGSNCSYSESCQKITCLVGESIVPGYVEEAHISLHLAGWIGQVVITETPNEHPLAAWLRDPYDIDNRWMSEDRAWGEWPAEWEKPLAEALNEEVFA